MIDDIYGSECCSILILAIKERKEFMISRINNIFNVRFFDEKQLTKNNLIFSHISGYSMKFEVFIIKIS